MPFVFESKQVFGYSQNKTKSPPPKVFLFLNVLQMFAYKKVIRYVIFNQDLI